MNNSRVFSIAACREPIIKATIKCCDYQSSDHGDVHPTIYYSVQTIPLMGEIYSESRPLRMLILCSIGIINMISAVDNQSYAYKQLQDRRLRTGLWL